MDTRRERADGTCPIIFRLGHHRRTVPISTGFFVPPKYWNENTREIKKTYEGVSSATRLNNLLAKKKADLMDSITALEESRRLDELTINELKNLLTKPSDSVCFFKYTEKIIDELVEAKSFGNSRAYKSALGALKNFYRKDTLRSDPRLFKTL